MIEKKSFTGGLSTDRDGAYLQPNQYLNALNIRVTSNEEGSEGVLTNIKGNTEVTFTLPSGTNTCIGSFEDAENHRVFYFIYNSSNSHMILCYFHKENTIRKVMEQGDFKSGEQGLNFSSGNLITGVGMNDDLLFFTDGETEPKRVNVERGLKKHDASYTQLNTYDSLAAYPTNMTDGMVTIIKESPLFPLTTTRLTDNTIDYKNLGLNVFTFAYRFVYVDGEISSLSAYSKLTPHPNENTTNPETDFNAIDLAIPVAQNISADVLEVEFLVKFNEENSFSVFYTEKDSAAISAHSTTPLSYRFKNSTIKLIIPDSDVTRYVSAVPVKAKALECAKGRVFLGNTTEGLSNINETGLSSDSDVSFVKTLTSGSASANYVMYRLIYRDSNQVLQTRYYRYVRVLGTSQDNGFYRTESPEQEYVSTDPHIANDWDTNSLDATRYPITQFDLDGTNITRVVQNASLTGSIIAHVEGFAPQSATEVSALQYSTNANTAFGSVVNLTSTPVPLVENLRVWKSNSSYKFGLIFSDKYGRQGRLIELTGDGGINIPDRDGTISEIVTNVSWTLPSSNQSDYIPDWAHSYSFVRTKSLNKTFFIQGAAESVDYYSIPAESGAASKNYTHNTHQAIGISLEGLLQEGLGYTYSEGDLITIYGYGNNLPNSVITLPLIGQDGATVFCESRDLGTLRSTAYAADFEIFTPKLTNPEEPYFEFGETYSITNPGQNGRTFSTSSGNFTGDAVIKGFLYDDTILDFFECASPSKDKINNWVQLTGRGYATTRFQQVHKSHSISFSENRITGSLLNGLSTFNPLDEKTLPSEMGTIQKILFTSKTESLGNTMLAIGTNETASVYIGEAQVQTAGGAAFLAVQTGVIGSVQVLRGSYGTLHPESVVEQNGRVYFLDALNGTCVQYDVNGLMPIGDKGIGSFFRERCDLIVTQNKTGCHGGFDANENEYILTIPEVSDVEQEYLDDYSIIIKSTNILNAFDYNTQTSYDSVSLSLSVNIKKGRKYILKVGQVNLNDSSFQEIEVRYSDNISAVTLDNANLNALESGDSVEFIATKDSSSLIFIPTMITDNPAQSDVFKIQTQERKPSYYKLDNGSDLTIAYSEDVRAWTTFYSYTPENMVNVGTQFITFKDGGLWKHDTNNTRNNFYGTQYVSRVSSISKEAPSAIKTFSNISVEGNVPPSFTHFRTESKYMDRDSSGNIPASPTYSDYIQSSDLSDSEFRQLEGVYYAGILRDRLQPAPSSYDEDTYNTNMMSGQKLTNQFMLFTLEFDNTSKVSVRFANIGFNAQRGHKI